MHMIQGCDTGIRWPGASLCDTSNVITLGIWYSYIRLSSSVDAMFNFELG